MCSHLHAFLCPHHIADVDLYTGDALYENNGAGTFSAVSGAPTCSNAQVCAWGDWSGDGLLDLIVGNKGSANVLYLNNGDTTFSSVTTTPITAGSGNTIALAWGDCARHAPLAARALRASSPRPSTALPLLSSHPCHARRQQ